MRCCAWGRWFVRRLSVDSRSSFREEYSSRLPGAVLERLATQGVEFPNPLQRKCLDALLEGKHEAAVINAETGSGKTYCFLLPILRLCTELAAGGGGVVPSPSSLVLVPTPHLGYQIESLFRALADPCWGSCVVHHSARLTLTPSTPLLIATPTSLVQYDLRRVLKHVRLVCIDEADLLLTGSERQSTFAIMNTTRYKLEAEQAKMTESQSVGNFHEEKFRTRFIFTAATLPSGGRQTVQARLKEWLPNNTLNVTTDNTHRLVPTADLKFVNIKENNDIEEDKEAVKEAVKDVVKMVNRSLTKAKREQLIKDLYEIATVQPSPKVLVFCNSVLSAHRLHRFLTRPQSDLCTPTSDPWWTGKVGPLYKQEECDVSSLENTLKKFQNDELDLLVCSDLGCRGLDLRNVTTVIQYDFPGNVADFIHRAGRTARAGRCGHVISYVNSESREMANQIRAAGEQSMEELFSRNKMLRRKLKNKKKQFLENTML